MAGSAARSTSRWPTTATPRWFWCPPACRPRRRSATGPPPRSRPSAARRTAYSPTASRSRRSGPTRWTRAAAPRRRWPGVRRGDARRWRSRPSSAPPDSAADGLQQEPQCLQLLLIGPVELRQYGVDTGVAVQRDSLGYGVRGPEQVGPAAQLDRHLAAGAVPIT